MPWEIEQDGDNWLVVAIETGEVMGAHRSRTRAVAQLRALYASESSKMSKPAGKDRHPQEYDPATGRYMSEGISTTRKGTKYSVGKDGSITVHVKGSPTKRWEAALDVFRERAGAGPRDMVQAAPVMAQGKQRVLTKPEKNLRGRGGYVGWSSSARKVKPSDGQVFNLLHLKLDPKRSTFGDPWYDAGLEADVWVGDGDQEPRLVIQKKKAAEPDARRDEPVEDGRLTIEGDRWHGKVNPEVAVALFDSEFGFEHFLHRNEDAWIEHWSKFDRVEDLPIPVH